MTCTHLMRMCAMTEWEPCLDAALWVGRHSLTTCMASVQLGQAKAPEDPHSWWRG